MIYVVFAKERHPWRRAGKFIFACSALGPDRTRCGEHLVAYVKTRRFKW